MDEPRWLSTSLDIALVTQGVPFSTILCIRPITFKAYCEYNYRAKTEAKPLPANKGILIFDLSWRCVSNACQKDKNTAAEIGYGIQVNRERPLELWDGGHKRERMPPKRNLDLG